MEAECTKILLKDKNISSEKLLFNYLIPHNFNFLKKDLNKAPGHLWPLQITEDETRHTNLPSPKCISKQEQGTGYLAPPSAYS